MRIRTKKNECFNSDRDKNVEFVLVYNEAGLISNQINYNQVTSCIHTIETFDTEVEMFARMLELGFNKQEMTYRFKKGEKTHYVDAKSFEEADVQFKKDKPDHLNWSTIKVQ